MILDARRLSIAKLPFISYFFKSQKGEKGLFHVYREIGINFENLLINIEVRHILSRRCLQITGSIFLVCQVFLFLLPLKIVFEVSRSLCPFTTVWASTSGSRRLYVTN